jgi:subtilisin family serine protease
MMARRRNRLALVAVSLLSVLGFTTHGKADSGAIKLRRGKFDPLLERPALPERLRLATEPVEGYFLMQVEGPVDRALEARLREAGVERLAFVPDSAWIVRVPPGGLDALRGLRAVRWVGVVEPGFKLAPDLGTRPFADPERRAGGRMFATLDLFPGESIDLAADRARGIGLEVLDAASFSDTRRLTVRGTLAQLERAAHLREVAWIDEVAEIVERNRDARWVIQSGIPNQTPLWDRGLHGEGQIIGHIDTPIYYKSCYFLDLVQEVPGPDHRKIMAYRAYGSAPAFHGTHTAGIMAGDSTPVSGTVNYSGLASHAKISHTDLGAITGVRGSPSNLYDFLTLAHLDGARVHSNSWGDDTATAYTPLVRDVDLFAWDHEESLVVLASSNSPWLHTPENSKNGLAVGATHNGAMANEFCSGGSGPTIDGRRKPEIFAPGCEIYSAENQSLCGSIAAGGTSMAAPAIAASAVLVRQYFSEGWYPSGTKLETDERMPTGALVKAVLLNSATDITGMPGFPGEQEGWGRVKLDDAVYFAGDTRGLVVLADTWNARGLGTGVADHFSLDVASSSEPLELTLVWTEPPAALLAAEAVVNDLDLVLTSPSGLRYRGNNFDTELGESVPGGAADSIDNVEMVRITTPEVGEWRVSVTGAAVREARQGYALVATGRGIAGRGGSLRYASHVVNDSGPLGNGNGIVDPGETVTLTVSLVNLSDETAAQPVARLISNRFDLASVSMDTASFPTIAPGATAASLSPSFRVRVSPAARCGETLRFHVRSEHPGSISDSSFTVLVGSPGDAGLPAVCLPLACAEAAFATAVSPTLQAAAVGRDLELSWPLVQGAIAYELWRSPDRDFSTPELVGSFQALEHVESGELDRPQSWYYLLRAVDPCGWPSDP